MGGVYSCYKSDRCCYCNNAIILNNDEPCYFKIISSDIDNNHYICYLCITSINTKKIKNNLTIF